jgi:hypothetical protein
MTTLADDLVPDELWALVEPVLPAPPRRWFAVALVACAVVCCNRLAP